MNREHPEIIIVGAGILGAAIARAPKKQFHSKDRARLSAVPSLDRVTE
jgi:hypothetical protein